MMLPLMRVVYWGFDGWVGGLREYFFGCLLENGKESNTLKKKKTWFSIAKKEY
jgi:hypothetical protein